MDCKGRKYHRSFIPKQNFFCLFVMIEMKENVRNNYLLYDTCWNEHLQCMENMIYIN